jgi:hypothetical protein
MGTIEERPWLLVCRYAYGFDAVNNVRDLQNQVDKDGCRNGKKKKRKV